MAIVRKIDHKPGDGNPDYMIFCPGCKCGHGLWVCNPNSGAAMWTFNENMDKPTFNPSILVHGRSWTAKGQSDYEAWRAAGFPERKEKEFENMETVCHSFIRDGMIQFLPDCTHELRGKTIPLPEF